MVTITNELKNINKRCDRDREELLIRIKGLKERKGLDATSLRGDIQLLAQQVTELKCELREKNADNPPVQREIINRPDICPLEDDLPTDLTRG